MNANAKAEHVTRENILMLLSDDEVASVSTAESMVRPLDGEEYLDLEDLEQGVRSALGTMPRMGNMLLRRYVPKDTWAKIQRQLAALHAAKLPSTARTRHTSVEKGMNMLWTIAVVLLVLWALGFATSYTMGGLIHILLILAAVAVVVRLIQGRRSLP